MLVWHKANARTHWLVSRCSSQVVCTSPTEPLSCRTFPWWLCCTSLCFAWEVSYFSGDFRLAEFYIRIIFVYEIFLTNRKKINHFKMPFSLCAVCYAETSWMWSSSSSFLSMQIWNKWLLRGSRGARRAESGLTSLLYFWSRLADFTASCWGCIRWAGRAVLALFCEKRSIGQTLNLRVAAVSVSSWNEQEFCVAFLPWVWRTWDGFMHFRLGTFLAFMDLFKPLILPILYWLISSSFPLPPSTSGELMNNLKDFSKKTIKYILWKVQHALSPAAIFLGIFFI